MKGRNQIKVMLVQCSGDVSAKAEMMQLQYLQQRSDVCKCYVRSTHHLRKQASLAKPISFARQGKHRFDQKEKTVLRSFLFGRDEPRPYQSSNIYLLRQSSLLIKKNQRYAKTINNLLPLRWRWRTQENVAVIGKRVC